jgi:hypothetical protein
MRGGDFMLSPNNQLRHNRRRRHGGCNDDVRGA